MTAQALSTHYRHLQGAGGLEILCEFIFTAESALTETLKMLLRVSRISLVHHFLTVEGPLILFYLEK